MLFHMVFKVFENRQKSIFLCMQEFRFTYCTYIGSESGSDWARSWSQIRNTLNFEFVCLCEIYSTLLNYREFIEIIAWVKNLASQASNMAKVRTEVPCVQWIFLVLNVCSTIKKNKFLNFFFLIRFKWKFQNRAVYWTFHTEKFKPISGHCTNFRTV